MKILRQKSFGAIKAANKALKRKELIGAFKKEHPIVSIFTPNKEIVREVRGKFTPADVLKLKQPGATGLNMGLMKKSKGSVLKVKNNIVL